MIINVINAGWLPMRFRDFPHIKPELREIAENILRKLYSITDTEFLTLTFGTVNFNDNEKMEV